MRLAHRTPTKCSGCYTQKLDQAHVDFESAWEGPQVDPANPRSPHIEWLILCEDCVRTAHRMLPDEVDDRAQLRDEVDTLKAQLAEEQNFSQRLEDALAHRPVQRKPKSAGQRKRT